MRKEKNKINNIRKGKGEIITNGKEIIRTTLKAYTQLNWKI
jgi:hypothetical protein